MWATGDLLPDLTVLLDLPGEVARARLAGEIVVAGVVGEIEKAPIDKLIITNTIPLSEAGMACQKIRQLTVAPLIAETIQRIASGESVMSLFSDQNQLF